MVAHRLKALEHVAWWNGRWEHAQYMELITPENRGYLPTPADLGSIVEERKSLSKLYSGISSGSYFKGKGGGTRE